MIEQNPTPIIQVDDPPFLPDTKLQCRTINVVMNQGGLGDMIARLPAIRQMLHTHPHITINLWCPEYFIPLAEQFIQIEGIQRLNIKKISDYCKHCKWDEPHYDFIDNQYNSFASNLTTHAFHKIVNQEIFPTDPRLSYPRLTTTPYDKSSNQIVITANYTAPARRFIQSEFDKLCDFFRSIGKQIILLGSSKTIVRSDGKNTRTIESATVEPSNMNGISDRRNQTTLLKAVNIIANSQCLLGVDNGLIHLGACTNTPIVVGFTSVSPKHRIIIRQGEPNKKICYVEPDESLTCRFCQSRMGTIWGHRFKYCMYDNYKCCEQMSAEKFIRAYQAMMAIHGGL